jgi:hypothetical protein
MFDVFNIKIYIFLLYKQYMRKYFESAYFLKFEKPPRGVKTL